MSWPAFAMTLRLRLPSTGFAALGLVAVLLVVGALFPAVGHSFGKLNIPNGVSHLLGGADYGTITGWFRSEIGSIYGPLLISAMAITGAVSTTAGEEEDRILALVLAHPVDRRHLIAAKAGAIAVVVWLIAVATWLAVAVGTGRRALATGVAAAVGVAGWLINGFAPLVAAIAWLKYLSPFYYYAGHDPLTQGVDIPDLAILGMLTLALTTVAMLRIQRRDLRA